MRLEHEIEHLAERPEFQQLMMRELLRIIDPQWHHGNPITEALAIGVRDEPGQELMVWSTPITWAKLNFGENDQEILTIAAYDLLQVDGHAPTRVLVVHDGQVRMDRTGPEYLEDR